MANLPAPTPRSGPLSQSDAFQRAARTLEEAVGGREALIDAIIPACASPEQEYIVGLIADPHADGLSLGDVLIKGKVPLPTLLKLLQDARLAQAHFKALEHIAARVPQVAQQAMDDAVEHRRECRVCNGTGRLSRWDPSNPDAPPTLALCADCDGHGFVVHFPKVADKTLALELGRLLTKGPGVSIAVNQQTSHAQVFTGGVSYDDLTRLTDPLVFGPPRRASGITPAAAEAAAVDPPLSPLAADPYEDV